MPQRRQPTLVLAILAGGGIAFLAVLMLDAFDKRGPLLDGRSGRAGAPDTSFLPPMKLAAAHNLTLWWDQLGPMAQMMARPSGPDSNIHPGDYIGPAACQQCHPKQHEQWSGHPHRGMNALATNETVRGDFSGKSSLMYRGGRVEFETVGDARFMKLESAWVRRVYRITQTIGIRFFQYYVGRQVEGPEPPGHHFYQKDHVLPFGYWLDEREWVPVVHIGPEKPDDERYDPFVPPESGSHYAEYAVSCNHCHTTFPLGDLLARRTEQMGEHAPIAMHWSLKKYLEQSHPAEYPELARMLVSGNAGRHPMADWDAPTYAVTLGVSCEACHLGARAHAASGGKVPPAFFPTSPNLMLETAALPDPGRTHDNLNWACGRCHTGKRPMFAAGMSTWNSVEYADAVKGACYSKLRCIDCHEPHQALGRAWTVPPERDDAVCLKCHETYREADRRSQHTHHPAGSAGDRCLNCHMPRLNEGLQDVVRTHMIYSPTRADMLQANHPNACNLCHTDRPLDWTLGLLKDWYGKTCDEAELARHVRDRSEPAALGWLASADPSVRLVAADALVRSRNRAALPRVLDALDDPYLLNRQFAARRLEDMLGFKFRDLGYHFYQSRDERSAPIGRIRERAAAMQK